MRHTQHSPKPPDAVASPKPPDFQCQTDPSLVPFVEPRHPTGGGSRTGARIGDASLVAAALQHAAAVAAEALCKADGLQNTQEYKKIVVASWDSAQDALRAACSDADLLIRGLSSGPGIESHIDDEDCVCDRTIHAEVRGIDIGKTLPSLHSGREGASFQSLSPEPGGTSPPEPPSFHLPNSLG